MTSSLPFLIRSNCASKLCACAAGNSIFELVGKVEGCCLNAERIYRSVDWQQFQQNSQAKRELWQQIQQI